MKDIITRADIIDYSSEGDEFSVKTKDMKYIEQEMEWDGAYYFVVATIKQEGCDFGSNGLEVEFYTILDDCSKNVLESVEWDLYNEFERQLIEEY